MSKVLIVSNDSSLKRFVDLTLSHNGFIVNAASDSSEGWSLLKEARFDLVIVDYQLRDESGLAFYKSLRQFGTSIPVMMVGEGMFDEFMLKDLSEDNYDYIIKPFKFDSLRVKINRLMQMNPEHERLITFGDFRIDVRQQLVMVKDKMIQLGKMEMKIFMLLARKTGGFVDPKKIKRLLEAEGNFYNMTTFYYVSKLRTKLKRIAGEALDISLIQNHGYQLVLKA
jgi:DNA-binding response OmpR family regulator